MLTALKQLRVKYNHYIGNETQSARFWGFFHRTPINMLGRYSFAMPDEVKRGELRPLRTTEKP